ncbi:MAG TPA: MBOAT family O-acyltransferase [Candidatus Rubrimentiphilum sp.]|nr:MBOAT family O-acyltransferase [Candidatus Rubrimentiphilum sp.]
MNVPSFEFLGFATVVAALINISNAAPWRRSILLLANIGFVLTFTHSPLQLVPFGGLLVLGYAGMKLVEVHKNKAVFIVLLAALIFLFCLLKQYTFVPHALFLQIVYFTVGMSYVFFRVLHLVIDAYQDALPDRVGLLSYANYTLNFTSLVSGPIQLYPDYLRTESVQPAALDQAAVGRALERIVAGFFKVSVLSPLLFYAQTVVVHALTPHLSPAQRVVDGALVLSIFPVYVYINFSGYMDFVIGTARFLRLELPENFNRPFIATSFIEFWGRWHMTLSNWLKTYVYSPLLLSLMRRFPSRSAEPYLGVFVYFVTFFLIGLWHGRTSMFVVFGVLLGLGVSVNKLHQILLTQLLGAARYRALRANSFYAAASRGLTFWWFAFAMLWFWSSWVQLAEFARILGAPAVLLATGLVLSSAALLLTGLKYLEESWLTLTGAGSPLASRYVRAAWCTTLAVVVVSVAVILNAPSAHIVYKAF